MATSGRMEPDELPPPAESRRQPLDALGYWSARGVEDWSPQELLRRLRMMRGWTQQQLAEKAGLVQSNVARAESDTDVRWSTIQKLVEAMGCRLELRIRPVVPFELR